MNVNIANIPAELIARPQWVTWKYVKGDKVLFNPANGETADSTNPATWSTFEKAREAAVHRHHAGIGYVFTKDDPYTGTDLDDCLATDGRPFPYAHAIIDEFSTYTEVSPSGTGVKMWTRGAIPKNRQSKKGAPHKIEMYTTARYFTVTGKQLAGTSATIHEDTGELMRLFTSLRPQQATSSMCTDTRPSVATAGSEYERRYALGALERAHQAMMDAGEGERHNTRIQEAYGLAGYIPHISADEITAALAVNFGENEASARTAIADGIAAGKQALRTIPPPRYPDPQDAALGLKISGYNEHDELDQLDADTLRQRLRATMAERDHWQQEAKRLDGWREWALTVIAKPGKELSPAEKITALSLHTEMEYRQSRGMTDPAPILIASIEKDNKKIPGFAERAGVSPDTYGKALPKLAEAGVIAYTKQRDPKTGHTRVLIGPGAFFDPSTWTAPEPRNHGGTRIKRCLDCGSDNLMEQTRIICRTCGSQQGDAHERNINPPVTNDDVVSPDPHLAALEKNSGSSLAPQVAVRPLQKRQQQHAEAAGTDDSGGKERQKTAMSPMSLVSDVSDCTETEKDDALMVKRIDALLASGKYDVALIRVNKLGSAQLQAEWQQKVQEAQSQQVRTA